ncbi:MAG: hypothetical protein ABI741_12445 [Ferruginibacter sp.]
MQQFDNFLLCIPVFLYVPFLYRLFFIKGNSNILFWGLLVQWLAVSVQVTYCSVVGMPLNDLFKNSIFPAQLMEYTDYLSITGIYFYTLGIYTAVRKLQIAIPEKIWDIYDPRKMFQVYIVVSIIISATQAVIWLYPNLVQYFFFFFYIKWGFFLATFIAVFKRAPDLKLSMLAIIVIEFVLGLSSFFASNFVNIVLFSLIAFVSTSKKIGYWKGALFTVFGAVLFHMAVLWTASKTSYRSYLNQGQAVQSVTVSKDAARKKLLELIVKVDANTYSKAIEEVVNRVGYIQYFAAAVRVVPSRIPYADGRIYIGAISHFLVPRFINPDKEVLDDSKHTNKYTGLGLSGKAQGTSFSLGSFADAYIDLGPILMFIPIFLFGLLIGLFFKYLYKPNLWGLIFTGPLFLLINVFGSDTVKALGFVLIYFLVITILKRYLMNILDPIMRQK